MITNDYTCVNANVNDVFSRVRWSNGFKNKNCSLVFRGSACRSRDLKKSEFHVYFRTLFYWHNNNWLWKINLKIYETKKKKNRTVSAIGVDEKLLEIGKTVPRVQYENFWKRRDAI